MSSSNVPVICSGDGTADFSNYCRFWRTNRSHHEATELAMILRALRKVSGHIGRNVKPIYWAGMVDSDKKKSILINADEISGTYPIPFQEMDILVGQVVREAFCNIEWSEWVRDRIQERVSIISKDEMDYLTHFVAAAEDIYIRELTDSSIWALYLTNYWRYLDYKKPRDASLPPTASSLSNVWRKLVLLGERPDSLHSYYKIPLSILSVYTAAIKIATRLRSITERRKSRVEIYLRMWELLSRAISEWEKFHPTTDGVKIQDESGPKTNIENMEGEKDDLSPQDEEREESGTELAPEMASEVSSILEEGDTDMTRDISLVVEDPEAKEMTTTRTRAIAESNVVPDPQQVKRLKKIFERQRALQKILRKRHTKRSLEQGKLDSHRLYRVPLDGKIFKANTNPKMDAAWNIAIVADSSASMGGQETGKRPWDSAEKTFISLVEAARGFRNHLEVYGYHEDNNECVLIELFRSNKLFTIVPSGRTPSGQAIMAVALSLRERYKKSLIIHITDGAANCGLNVAESIGYCAKNGIDLITIGCGCNKQTRDFLRARFPEMQLLLMDDIQDLGVGLERLFRHRLLPIC